MPSKCFCIYNSDRFLSSKYSRNRSVDNASWSQENSTSEIEYLHLSIGCENRNKMNKTTWNQIDSNSAKLSAESQQLHVLLTWFIQFEQSVYSRRTNFFVFHSMNSNIWCTISNFTFRSFIFTANKQPQSKYGTTAQHHFLGCSSMRETDIFVHKTILFVFTNVSAIVSSCSLCVGAFLLENNSSRTELVTSSWCFRQILWTLEMNSEIIFQIVRFWSIL